VPSDLSLKLLVKILEFIHLFLPNFSLLLFTSMEVQNLRIQFRFLVLDFYWRYPTPVRNQSWHVYLLLKNTYLRVLTSVQIHWYKHYPLNLLLVQSSLSTISRTNIFIYGNSNAQGDQRRIIEFISKTEDNKWCEERGSISTVPQWWGWKGLRISRSNRIERKCMSEGEWKSIKWFLTEI
jgi:hypothetical protein